MKKTLVFLVFFVMLFSLGSMSLPAEAVAQINVSQQGVRLASQPQQAVVNAANFYPQYNPLYPQAINPPETCHVPQVAPLGQDTEMLLGPWGTGNPLLALSQPSSWNGELALGSAVASTNLDVITLTTEDLVAVWADSAQKVKYATWGAGSGWSVQSLPCDPPGDPGAPCNQSASGSPVLISRGPKHWAIFARFNTKIMMIEWYMGSFRGGWQEVPGISDAASDPAVISQDAGHMGVFYRTGSGEVKFNEWEGTWYQKAISLGMPAGGKASFPILSALSAISRNSTHAAVFGVDGSGQLWIRERTSLNQSNWSDTTWVKVLEGVALEQPAVVSRNANHIGIVVKGIDNQVYYTRWALLAPIKLYLPLVGRPASGAALAIPEDDPEQQALAAVVTPPGWTKPFSLGDADIVSALTVVPRSRDSLAVFGITSAGVLKEIIWTEDTLWGSWQDIGGGVMETDQVIAGVTRRMNDMMLLGRLSDGKVWSKNFTSLDKPVTDDILSSTLDGLPHGQVLAFVDGKWVWVSVTRQASGTWQVNARELSTAVTANINLTHDDSGQVTNRVAVAAADLAVNLVEETNGKIVEVVDGNTEVVVATLHGNGDTIDISVLKLSYQNPTTLVITPSSVFEWEDPSVGEDVNVAVGDLDGDMVRDEITVGYREGTASMRFGIFRYIDGIISSLGGPKEINYVNHCLGVPDCTIGQHDLEMAIGRVAREFIEPIEREQLVVLDVSAVTHAGVTYAQDWVLMNRFITETMSLEPIVPNGCKYLNPSTSPGNASSIAANPYTAGLGFGDMNADGVGDIVYSFGDRLAILHNTFTCGYQVMPGLPDQERTLVVGDFDTDGRGEAAVAYRDATTDVNMIEMVEGNALRRSAQRIVVGGYTALAADTDNDTFVAELAGCKTFADINVVAVINGAPRWYQDGQPIQNSRGLYGCTEEGGGSVVNDGTTTSNGVSVSLGFEYEFDGFPGGNNHDLGFKIFGGYEHIDTTGTKHETSWSKTRDDGYDYDAPSLGMVVYNSTEFTCYFYDAYPPTAPEAKSRMMVCSPTGRTSAEDFKPLDDWISKDFKAAAGPSWADVGHVSPGGVHTNDLEVQGNYPARLPEDRMIYAWSDSPIKVSYSSLPGYYNYWHLSDMTGYMTETITSTTHNGTAGGGGTLFGFFLDVAWIGSWTFEDSSTTTWASTFEYGGGVEKYQDPNRLCYDIVPYITKTKIRSQAGAVYEIVEMDYYVPTLPYNCAKETNNSTTAYGLARLYPYQAQGWRDYLTFP